MTLDHDPDTLPENWVDEDRWFCFNVIDDDKRALAPWVKEDPRTGEYSPPHARVGWDWDGVRTNIERPLTWVNMRDLDWHLGTAVPKYDDDYDGVRDIFIDLDDVVDPESGEIHPVARKIIERADSYAAFSASWTGIHVYLRGRLPDGYSASFETGLEPVPNFPDAEIEVYTRSRFIGVTGRHIPETPTTVERNQPFIDMVFRAYGSEDEEEYDNAGGVDVEDREPEYTKTETRTTETTDDIELVYDAISHTSLHDVRLRSQKTEERPNGAMSLDPSWEKSKSGTRLGYEDGGFIYRKGMVGLDILQVVALEERIISSVNEYPEGEDFWNAVDALRDRGADIPEYEPPNEGGGYMTLLASERLSRVDPQGQRRMAKKRGIPMPSVDDARDRLETLVKDAVANGDRAVASAPTGVGKTTTVSKEPWLASGANPDNLPTIVASGTHEARDEAVEESRKYDVDHAVLKGRKELCTVCAGDYDPANIDEDDPDAPTPVLADGKPISEWIDFWCDERGHSISHVHKWAEEVANRPLPCEQGEGECRVKGQFEDIPRNDEGMCEYDVIHCTYQFLLVPSMRMHTNIFIDEKPSFTDGIPGEVVRQSVNAVLDRMDAPVDSYSELVYASEHGHPPGLEDRDHYGGLTKREFIESFQDEMDKALSPDPEVVDCPHCGGDGEVEAKGADSQDLADYGVTDEEGTDGECHVCDGSGRKLKHDTEVGLRWFRDHPEAHSLAPAFARAIWQAEERSGGRKHARVRYSPPRLDDGNDDSNAWNQMHIDVVLDDQWEVEEVAGIPDFSLANSVIGLDAHPQPNDPHWMTMVDEGIETRRIFDAQERSMYRRYERGLFTVQVGDATQPVTTQKYWGDNAEQKVRSIVHQLDDTYGEEFDSAITSKSHRPLVEPIMDEVTDDESEMMHYGAEESRNDFAGKDVGLVIGSIDPGDEMIMNRIARLGLDAEPATKECPNCSGSGDVEPDEDDDAPEGMCGTCKGEGEVREKGREFEGPDAEMARAVLRGVREHHVAQSAGRWARDADDPEDGATVYVVTDASPTGFIDAKVPGPVWTANAEQRERLEYVQSQPDGATAKEVMEACGCSKRAALRTLNTAEEEGLLEKTPGAGPSGATIYWPGEEFNPGGSVDLEPPESGTTTDPVQGTDTYTVVVHAHPAIAFDQLPEEGGDWQYQSTFEWYEGLSAPPS